jgi:hypothetical protein
MNETITQLEGFINRKNFKGQIEDIRGAWPYVKAYIEELETPWFVRVWRKIKK